MLLGRDITGYIKGDRINRGSSKASGAFSGRSISGSSGGAGGSTYCSDSTTNFDANAGTATDNLIAGHANGVDIHPYTMRVLYLIAY